MKNESKKEMNDRSQWSVAINKQTSKQNTHTATAIAPAPTISDWDNNKSTNGLTNGGCQWKSSPSITR